MSGIDTTPYTAYKGYWYTPNGGRSHHWIEADGTMLCDQSKKFMLPTELKFRPYVNGEPCKLCLAVLKNRMEAASGNAASTDTSAKAGS